LVDFSVGEQTISCTVISGHTQVKQSTSMQTAHEPFACSGANNLCVHSSRVWTVSTYSQLDDSCTATSNERSPAVGDYGHQAARLRFDRSIEQPTDLDVLDRHALGRITEVPHLNVVTGHA